jgi:hypothetical protein
MNNPGRAHDRGDGGGEFSHASGRKMQDQNDLADGNDGGGGDGGGD